MRAYFVLSGHLSVLYVRLRFRRPPLAKALNANSCSALRHVFTYIVCLRFSKRQTKRIVSIVLRFRLASNSHSLLPLGTGNEVVGGCHLNSDCHTAGRSHLLVLATSVTGIASCHRNRGYYIYCRNVFPNVLVFIISPSLLSVFDE